MAVVTKSYLIEGASITTHGFSVIECVDIFYVEQLNTNFGGAFAMWDAINATGLPTPWTPHPVIPGLNLVSYTPTPEGTSCAKVALRYVNSNPQLFIRGGTCLSQIQTDMDRLGNPILVSNQNTGASPPVSASAAIIQSGVLNVLAPQSTLVVRRVRAGIFYGGIDPAAQSVTFVGTTNDDSWFGCSPGTLLCENVGFNNDGFGGVAWNMEYEFRYEKRKWSRTTAISWIDRETGEPGKNLTKAPGFDAGTPSSPSDPQYGRKIANWYEQIPWAAMLG